MFFGLRWCDISRLLPGRTGCGVKNRFRSSARKKWQALTTSRAADGMASQLFVEKLVGTLMNDVPSKKVWNSHMYVRVCTALGIYLPCE